MRSNISDTAYIAVNGFCMALADSVPGVSGGTIVFIMGLYDKFITSLVCLLHGTRSEKITALSFLVRLGIGWTAGMAGAVTVLSGVFVSGIYQVSSLFLGFVAISVPLVISEEREAVRGHMKCLPFAALGAAAVVALSCCKLSSYVHDLGFSLPTALYVFAAGILAISAMVLPGISGSSLLMSFGLYVPIITGLRELMSFNFDSLWLIMSLGLGVIAGVFLTLRTIKRLLEKHRPASVYAILGMMTGSLYVIVTGPETLKIPQPSMTLETFDIRLFTVGVVCVFGLHILKKRLKDKGVINNGDADKA